MREQIHKSLLITGLISVVISFLVAGILYYQGMQARAIHEIGHLTVVAADGMTGDMERDTAYLDKIRENSHRELRILWVDKEGTVLYESSKPDKDYLDAPEIAGAKDSGTGQSVRKDNAGLPMAYFAQELPDESILRFGVQRVAPAGILSPVLPEILLFLVVFSVGCLWASDKETDHVLKPLRKVEGLISDIMEGLPERPIPGGYKELQPLVNKVREQKQEIQNYMDDLEEERNTIRTVVDTISDGIILLNDRQEIVDVNARIQEIFEKQEGMRYRKVADLYHNEDWLRAVQLAYEKKERHEYTMTIHGHPYRASMAHIELADGMKGLLIVLHNLTATYAAEKMRREFSANVSHELKTPLTSISGFAEMIANGMYQNEADVKLFGSRIFEESRRMMALIETIMHLSKIEENQTTITWKPVDMGAAAHYAADLIEPQADHRHVTIHVDAQPLYVYGNQALLFELVMNCVDNAVKYNKEGGQVNVTVHGSGMDTVEVRISDTGIGIPKDKQARVFERFYRADESRTKATGGSGLGLAICKHIVTQHKGTIEISSIEGEGTTILIELPRLSEAELAKEEAATSAAQLEAKKAESGELDEPKTMGKDAAEEETGDEAVDDVLDAEEMETAAEESSEDSVKKQNSKTKKEKKGKKYKKTKQEKEDKKRR